MMLHSDLWVDQPDAVERIAQRLDAGVVSEAVAARLTQLVTQGYCTFSIDRYTRTFRDLDDCVDRLWAEKPDNIAFSRDTPAMPMSVADEATDRRVRYRLHDIHAVCPSALELYLHPDIFRYVELIFDQTAVAFQSLYFEFSAEQSMHRDPILVPVTPQSHLLAAWIALEDIHDDSGPLMVVPGSHRIAYYEFEPGQIMYDAATVGEDELSRARDWYEEQLSRCGLAPLVYTPSAGEVLLWHHSLFHYSTRRTNTERTRKSFVVHFSTRAHYHTRGITLYDPVSGTKQRFFTSTRLRRHGNMGFDTPLNGPPVSGK